MKGDHRRALWGLVVAITLALGQSANAVIGTLDLGFQTAAQLANALVGAGVTISNVTYSGATNSAGTFTGGTGIIGLDQGVILSSGDIRNAVGPNLQEGITTILDLPGDPDLDTLSGFETFDATVLEFDFVPNADRVFFQYVFASDEYNEYVNSEFNDVFAFFINGVNCATVGALPVSINTINNGNPVGTLPAHPELYINNDIASGAALNTEMDGLTVVLTCQANVIPNGTNHMKLAIADASDTILDSNVFLRTGSLSTTPPPSITSHPASQTIVSGATATMSVVASGSGLSYQWYIGTSGNTGSPIGGATSNSYTTPALISNTRYWVRVSNSSGSADSSTATITVVGAPTVKAADLVIDFGPAAGGVWNLYNGDTASGYAQLHPTSPEGFVTGDLDNNGIDEVILDFGAAGIWIRENNTSWSQLHTTNPSHMATGDLDGNGQDEVIIDFPGAGIWVRKNNTSWEQLHPFNSNYITVGRLDSGTAADVIIDFPIHGLWINYNNDPSNWFNLHTLNSQRMAVGDLDGNGGDDIVVDFAGSGLWIWRNNAFWTQLHTSDATVMTIGDIDGSGRADAIISFPGFGVWAWMNATAFKQLHISNGAILRTADIDGSGRADVIISFPGFGIWAWMNDTNWIQIHVQNPEGITEGHLDGN